MPCSAAPCHAVNGMAPHNAPSSSPTDDDKLYTNRTTYVSKACGGLKRVVPADPQQSALIKLLSGPCGMTPRMPYGCSPEAGDVDEAKPEENEFRRTAARPVPRKVEW